MIAELVNKRGIYFNKDQEVVTLDNNIIEAQLGKFNILCMEDIVYELNSCGNNFNDILSFLG